MSAKLKFNYLQLKQNQSFIYKSSSLILSIFQYIIETLTANP